ncbi:O-antigen ligase family protein [Candidatus Falkowbacteria bacterium]|nr:O-antigen ligase family protein [Candidatus Falkowbacteria bacterium]NCQ12623.1 O-antigen ligase family protein [Candidatus Falkowbacteria bacterium]OIO05763.1 MAG: hypothetical protein AUJ26_02375 [Candidatus Falkowbacteria bacterium CG1_02_37_21]
MQKKFKKYLARLIEYSFYVFVFSFLWQTKLILRPASSNFNEISLYFSHFLLLLILIEFFVYKLRFRGEEEPVSPLWLTLAGLELGILFSFFFASDQWLSFYFYVLFLSGIALFYLLREGHAAYDCDDPGVDKVKIIYSFLASLFLQATLGIYQFLTQHAPANKYLGLALHDPNTLGTSVVEAVSGRWLRAYGGFDHPNIFGGVLAVALVISAYLLASRKVIRRKSDVVESLSLFIFHFVALFALFFSFSRAAWLATIVGWLVLCVVLALKRDAWIFGRFLVLMFFSAVMVLIVVIPYQDLCRVRIEATSRLENKSVTERLSYVQEAKELWSQNWVTGVGVGNYLLALEKKASVKKAAWDYQPVHNVFLLLGAESGIFTVLFFVSFLFILITKNRREVFAPALFATILVLMLFDHWLISLPFGIIFLFLILGLL